MRLNEAIPLEQLRGADDCICWWLKIRSECQSAGDNRHQNSVIWERYPLIDSIPGYLLICLLGSDAVAFAILSTLLLSRASIALSSWRNQYHVMIKDKLMVDEIPTNKVCLNILKIYFINSWSLCFIKKSVVSLYVWLLMTNNNFSIWYCIIQNNCMKYSTYKVIWKTTILGKKEYFTIYK